jgi:hypothetical protein
MVLVIGSGLATTVRASNRDSLPEILAYGDLAGRGSANFGLGACVKRVALPRAPDRGGGTRVDAVYGETTMAGNGFDPIGLSRRR